MSNIPLEQLEKLYQELCKIAVDPQFENKVCQQIQTAILNYEAKNIGLTLDMILLIEGEYPSIESIIKHSKNPDGKRLTAQIDKYPKLKFAVTLVNQLFEDVSCQPNLPHLLKHLIYQIRMPFLRLTFQNLEASLKPNHPANLLIAELLSFIPFWRNENQIGYPTFTKLSASLSFEKTSDASILSQFESTLETVRQIKNNQIKRSLIFEKRLVETETSLNQKQQAQKLVQQLIKYLRECWEIPDFVERCLEETWSLLLNLEYVRKDDLSFNKALNTALTLILSCQKIRNKEQLDWLFDILPQINEALSEGFERLAIEETVKSEFLAALESYHIDLIAHANESIANLSARSNQEADLIRLQPADSVNSLEADQHKKEEKSASKKTINASDFKNLEAIEAFFSDLEDVVRNPQTTNQLSFSLSDINKLFNDPRVADHSSNYDKHIKLIGKWFFLSLDNKPHKLIYINPDNGMHLFVSQEAKKSHEISYKAFEEQLKTEKILPLSNSRLFQKAIKTSIETLSNYLVGIKQQIAQAAQDDIANKASKKPVKESTTNKETEPESQENLAQSIKNKQENNSPINITHLAVGSWVKIIHENKKTKCKLAAKIASKNTYVFVDRQGKKLFELQENNLIALYKQAKIELIDIETTKEQILATVITKNRSLKSENII